MGTISLCHAHWFLGFDVFKKFNINITFIQYNMWEKMYILKLKHKYYRNKGKIQHHFEQEKNYVLLAARRPPFTMIQNTRQIFLFFTQTALVGKNNSVMAFQVMDALVLYHTNFHAPKQLHNKPAFLLSTLNILQKSKPFCQSTFLIHTQILHKIQVSIESQHPSDIKMMNISIHDGPDESCDEIKSNRKSVLSSGFQLIVSAVPKTYMNECVKPVINFRKVEGTPSINTVLLESKEKINVTDKEALPLCNGTNFKLCAVEFNAGDSFHVNLEVSQFSHTGFTDSFCSYGAIVIFVRNFEELMRICHNSTIQYNITSPGSSVLVVKYWYKNIGESSMVFSVRRNWCIGVLLNPLHISMFCVKKFRSWFEYDLNTSACHAMLNSGFELNKYSMKLSDQHSIHKSVLAKAYFEYSISVGHCINIQTSQAFFKLKTDKSITASIFSSAPYSLTTDKPERYHYYTVLYQGVICPHTINWTWKLNFGDCIFPSYFAKLKCVWPSSVFALSHRYTINTHSPKAFELFHLNNYGHGIILYADASWVNFEQAHQFSRSDYMDVLGTYFQDNKAILFEATKFSTYIAGAEELVFEFPEGKCIPTFEVSICHHIYIHELEEFFERVVHWVRSFKFTQQVKVSGAGSLSESRKLFTINPFDMFQETMKKETRTYFTMTNCSVKINKRQLTLSAGLLPLIVEDKGYFVTSYSISRKEVYLFIYDWQIPVVSWLQAQKICRKKGYHLPTFTEPDDHQRLLIIIKKSFTSANVPIHIVFVGVFRKVGTHNLNHSSKACLRN